MKKKVGIIGALGIFAILFIASYAVACTTPPPWEECLYWSADVEVDLIAGQHYDVGDVHIWIDENILYIEFETTGAWVVTETHYIVVTDKEDIPTTKKGSPKIGHFPGGESYNPGVTTDIYSVDLDDLDMEDTTDLYIAFHAVVKKLNSCGQVIQGETAWGEGDPFDKGWGMYIHFVSKALPCYETGENTVHTKITHLYNNGAGPSYWTVELDENDEDVDALDHLKDPDTFLGWCIETGVTISGGWHEFALYSSHLPDLPKEIEDYEWDKINYMLNYKNANPGYTAKDAQQAVWYFTEQTTGTLTTGAQELIDEANDNGDGFYPGKGEVFAVILWGGSTKQMIIIEVDP